MRRAAWLALPDGNRPSIYFLACGPYVKVGYSRNVKARVESLRRPAEQTERPNDLNVLDAHLLAVVPGAPQGERLIHTLLAPHHVVGEWFHLNDDVRAHIALWQNAYDHSERAA